MYEKNTENTKVSKNSGGKANSPLSPVMPEKVQQSCQQFFDDHKSFIKSLKKSFMKVIADANTQENSTSRFSTQQFELSTKITEVESFINTIKKYHYTEDGQQNIQMLLNLKLRYRDQKIHYFEKEFNSLYELINTSVKNENHGELQNILLALINPYETFCKLVIDTYQHEAPSDCRSLPQELKQTILTFHNKITLSTNPIIKIFLEYEPVSYMLRLQSILYRVFFSANNWPSQQQHIQKYSEAVCKQEYFERASRFKVISNGVDCSYFTTIANYMCVMDDCFIQHIRSSCVSKKSQVTVDYDYLHKKMRLASVRLFTQTKNLENFSSEYIPNGISCIVLAIDILVSQGDMSVFRLIIKNVLQQLEKSKRNETTLKKIQDITNELLGDLKIKEAFLQDTQKVEHRLFALTSKVLALSKANNEDNLLEIRTILFNISDLLTKNECAFNIHLMVANRLATVCKKFSRTNTNTITQFALEDINTLIKKQFGHFKSIYENYHGKKPEEKKKATTKATKKLQQYNSPEMLKLIPNGIWPNQLDELSNKENIDKQSVNSETRLIKYSCPIYLENSILSVFNTLSQNHKLGVAYGASVADIVSGIIVNELMLSSNASVDELMDIFKEYSAEVYFSCHSVAFIVNSIKFEIMSVETLDDNSMQHAAHLYQTCDYVSNALYLSADGLIAHYKSIKLIQEKSLVSAKNLDQTLKQKPSNIVKTIAYCAAREFSYPTNFELIIYNSAILPRANRGRLSSCIFNALLSNHAQKTYHELCRLGQMYFLFPGLFGLHDSGFAFIDNMFAEISQAKPGSIFRDRALMMSFLLWPRHNADYQRLCEQYPRETAFNYSADTTIHTQHQVIFLPDKLQAKIKSLWATLWQINSAVTLTQDDELVMAFRRLLEPLELGVQSTIDTCHTYTPSV